MTEASSCESKHSSLGKITTVVVIMSPPQKSEVSLQPIDTSSQASIEEAEASLEDIPTNISPIATAYSSRSVSPPVDPSELWANANRAIDNMLHLKRSIDIKRQRAIWELGVMLHQNESQEATSVAAAKAIYSQSVLEAKTNFQEWQLWKPRQTGAIWSKKPRWPVPKPSVRLEPGKPPRLWCSMRNMANTCRA